MKTGKVEYAPDYKSKTRTPFYTEAQLRRIPASKHAREREHQRLQSAVVEAAKARHHAESDLSDESYRGSSCVQEEAALQQANCDIRVAVDALIAFEAEHGIEP